MSNPATCKHEQFRALVKVQTILDDSGAGYDQITTLSCTQCSTLFADSSGNTEQHARVYPVPPSRKRPVLEVVKNALDALPAHKDTPEHPGLPPAA